MKKIFLLTVLCCTVFAVANAQLFDKLRNKVVQKISNMAVKPSPSAVHSDSTSQAAATQDNAEIAVLASEQQVASPKNVQSVEIQFPVTGKTIPVTALLYGMDCDGDIKRILNTPGGKDFVKAGRERGLNGSDLDIAKELMSNDSLNAIVGEELRAKYGDTPEQGNCASCFVQLFAGDQKISITTNSIREEINGNKNGALMNVLGADAVGLTDLSTKMHYSIMNVWGRRLIVTKALQDVSNAMFLPKSVTGVYGSPDAIMHKSTGKFQNYNCTVISFEVPVKLLEDSNGEKNNVLPRLHALLEGNLTAAYTDAMMPATIPPGAKLLLDMYYTQELNSQIPSTIVNSFTGIRNNGLLVGCKIRTETGKEAVYMLKEVRKEQMDEGMFQLPVGFETMTDEQFQQRYKTKVGR